MKKVLVFMAAFTMVAATFMGGTANMQVEAAPVNNNEVIFDDEEIYFPPQHAEYQAWEAGKVYNKDDKVTYEGINYICKWWTQDAPSVNEWSAWEVLPDEDAHQPGNHPEWDPNKSYRKGELVHYKGVLFQAQWWTKGDKPKLSVYEATPWDAWVRRAG